MTEKQKKLLIYGAGGLAIVVGAVLALKQGSAAKRQQDIARASQRQQDIAAFRNSQTVRMALPQFHFAGIARTGAS